jgi:hypothetical protein
VHRAAMRRAGHFRAVAVLPKYRQHAQGLGARKHYRTANSRVARAVQASARMGERIMAILPPKPLPTFFDGDSSLVNLNNLGYAIQFLTDNDVKPTWHFYKTATQAIPASTWTTVNMGTVAFDSDGTFTGGGYATIQTPGIYGVAACMQVQAGTTGIGVLTQFLVTAGSSNPNHAAGSSVNIGLRGGLATASGADTAFAPTALTPWVLYQGDTIQAQIYTTVAATLDNNSNSSYMNGRFVCNFTGMLVRTP